MIEDLIDHPDPETRVSAVDEISRLAPQVPRDLIAAAVGGDIPAALAAVELAFPGCHVLLGKGRVVPDEPLYGASIWEPGEDPGEEEIPPIGTGEANSGLAEALMLALCDAADITADHDHRASVPAADIAETSGADRELPYLRKHETAAMVGLKALRCALPDGDHALDIAQAAALLVAEVLMNTMELEHAESCIAEFEQAVRAQVSARLIGHVAGHA